MFYLILSVNSIKCKKLNFYPILSVGGLIAIASTHLVKYTVSIYMCTLTERDVYQILLCVLTRAYISFICQQQLTFLNIVVKTANLLNIKLIPWWVISNFVSVGRLTIIIRKRSIQSLIRTLLKFYVLRLDIKPKFQ